MAEDILAQYFHKVRELYDLAQKGNQEAIRIYPQALAKYKEALANSQRDSLKKAQYYEQIEDQINKRVKQKLKDVKAQQKRKQYAGSPIELGQWTCDPDASEDYPDISKDEYLGNLDPGEYRKLTQDDELVGILADSPEFFESLLPLCIRRRKSSLALSNSKNALARRLISEENINLNKTVEEKTSHSNKFKGAFSKKSNW